MLPEWDRKPGRDDRLWHIPAELGWSQNFPVSDEQQTYDGPFWAGRSGRRAEHKHETSAIDKAAGVEFIEENGGGPGVRISP